MKRPRPPGRPSDADSITWSSVALKKVDDISGKLLSLQKQKQDYEARQIMEAYQKSGKSLQELMTFLNV